jgi:membrane protease YdiL (CAAX protease family)
MGFETRLLLAAGAVAAAILASSLLASGAWLHAGDPLLELSGNALVVELWLGVIAGVGALLAARHPRRLLGLDPGRLSWSQIGLLALGTLAASHALDGALDLTGLSEDSVLGHLSEVLEGAEGARLGLALLALGLLPGISEELLCRGLVQRGLARRFGPALAIPVAALVFGALHIEPIHGVFATLLGLYLGVVAHWAGSTRPAMFCHAANNLAAVLLGARVGDLPLPPWLSVVGGAALAAACLLAVGRNAAVPPAGADGGHTTGSAQA